MFRLIFFLSINQILYIMVWKQEDEFFTTFPMNIFVTTYMIFRPVARLFLGVGGGGWGQIGQILGPFMITRGLS